MSRNLDPPASRLGSREDLMDTDPEDSPQVPAAPPRTTFETTLADSIKGLASGHTLIKDINFVEEGLGKTWLGIRLKLLHLGYRTFGGWPADQRGPNTEDAYREIMHDLQAYYESVLCVVHGEEGHKMADAYFESLEEEDRGKRVRRLTAHIETVHKKIGLSFRTAVQVAEWDWDLAEADRAMLILQQTTQKGREVIQGVGKR